MKTLLLPIMLLLTLLFPGCGGGGGDAPFVENNGEVRVKVLDASTGEPLAGATVRLQYGGCVSGDDGSGTVSRVPSGNSPLSVTLPGYRSYQGSVLIAKDATADETVRLVPEPLEPVYDLVVVGAGSSGVAAAVQAARLGIRVALVEESDWIGGQMTASAVTSIDSYYVVRNESGIYLEFLNLIRDHYRKRGKSVGTCYFSENSTAFEPSVGLKVLYGMLSGAAPPPSLDLYLRSAVAGVQKSGNTVTGVRLEKGRVLNARVVMDATEYGDLLPLAGARYRAGNSTSDNLNLNACINAITYSAVLEKETQSTARQLVIQSAPPGFDTLGDPARVYRTPGGYSLFYDDPYPERFNVAIFAAWRGMPDSSNPANYDASRQRYQRITKTSMNYLYLDQPVTVRYLEERASRARSDGDAKLKAFQFIYFLQQHLGESLWSVATGEGFDTGYNRTVNSSPLVPEQLKPMERHFPQRPYVRESRRVIGIGTINAADIRRAGNPPMALKTFPSALVVGDYPIDLHGCGRDADLDCGDKSSDISPDPATAGGLFQIPFEAFIPERVDGLLVAEKNLSVSRLVQGAIRTQPTTMLIGQAAATIAALSVQSGVQPRQVPYEAVQGRLLQAGCLLEFPRLPPNTEYLGKVAAPAPR